MPIADDSASPAVSARSQFHTTHWSVVLAAGESDSAQAASALEQLCRTYWYPLYAYVRRKGHGREDAEDLTQQFFARLLQENRLGLADPARGKFRTFLLTALQNFLINEWTKAAREKRGGHLEFVSLHCDDLENRYVAETADERTPETIFEQQWAAAVMTQALEHLRAECAAGREQFFEALKTAAWGEQTSTSQSAAAALGLTEGAFNVALHRFRRRYREVLRQEIAHTVASNADVNDELRHLVAIVSRGSSGSA